MSLLHDARRGATIGLTMAGILTLWVLFLALFNGSLTFTSRMGVSYHVGAIIAAYVVGGALAGGLFGLGRPLLRWRAGAVALGILAALPVGYAILIGQHGPNAWRSNEWPVIIIFAVLLGGGGGLIVREFVRTADRDRRPPRKQGKTRR